MSTCAKFGLDVSHFGHYLISIAVENFDNCVTLTREPIVYIQVSKPESVG